MEQPVGLSFLGGFLIILAAGVACALVAMLIRKTTTIRMLLDFGVGVLGGLLVSFLLPMQGITLGNVIGWKAAVVLGAALPIAVFHFFAPAARRP